MKSPSGRLLSLLVMFCLLTASLATPVEAAPRKPKKAAKPPARVVLAEGTPLQLRPTADITSRRYKSGDPVRFEVVNAVAVQGARLVAEGAAAQGCVVYARGGRIGTTGSLVVSVDSVQAIDGNWIRLRAGKTRKGGAEGVLPARLIELGTAEFPNAKDALLARTTTIDAWTDQERVYAISSGRPILATPSLPRTGNAVSVTAGLRTTVRPAAEIPGDNVMVGDHPALVVQDAIEVDGATVVAANARVRGTVVAAGPTAAGTPEELVLTVDAVQAVNGGWVAVRGAANGSSANSATPNPAVPIVGVLGHGKVIAADVRVAVEVRETRVVLPTTGKVAARSLPFVPVWLGKQDSLTDEARDKALAAVAKQEPDPQQIFVLLHGWLNDRASSTASYKPVAENLRKLCQGRGQRVGIVGIQWDSYSGKEGTFVPQIIAAQIGAAKNPYVEKARFARRVGRHATRQLIIGLKEKFPNARIHVLAHSMGCEAMGHVIATRLHEKEDPVPAFQADRNLDLGLVCLAGSDLDSTFIYNSDLNQQTLPYLPKLTWITVPKILQGERDQVLAFHSIARGQEAMGNTLPKMKEDQIDLLFGGLRLYYDNDEIPPQHDWSLYYTNKRIGRLVDAALHVQDPARYRSADLQILEKAAKLPDDPAQLSSGLDGGSTALQLYLLYRLEKLLCGGPKHLADGSIAKLAARLMKNPDECQKQCPKHACCVVQQGYFPTQKMFVEARAYVEQKKSKKQKED